MARTMHYIFFNNNKRGEYILKYILPSIIKKHVKVFTYLPIRNYIPFCYGTFLSIYGLTGGFVTKFPLPFTLLSAWKFSFASYILYTADMGNFGV